MEAVFFTLEARNLTGFRSYLLPETLARLESGGGNVMALGAGLGAHTCGGAAALLTGDGWELTDLFVDAQARRQGIGRRLLDLLLEALASRDASSVRAGYALPPEDLAAMDALLDKRGFSPVQVRSLVFSARSADFTQHPLLGRAFSSRYRTPEDIRGFDALPPAALAELEADPKIPDYLAWRTLAPRCLPELSVALVRGGRVLAYLLGAESGGGLVLPAAVRRDGGPSASFLLLLREQLNRGWYRFGGDFPYYFSALTPNAEALARRLLGNACACYEEHTRSLALTSP